jgi:pyocin large subunit-like protein
MVKALLLALCLLVIAAGSSCVRSVPVKESAPPSPSVSKAGPEITKPDIGFASKKRLEGHYQKHGGEFGTITEDEYLRQAQMLRDRPAGGEILEERRPDGVICRFDRKTGAFLAFGEDGVIKTFFKPDTGEIYFKRQMHRKHK